MLSPTAVKLTGRPYSGGSGLMDEGGLALLTCGAVGAAAIAPTDEAAPVPATTTAAAPVRNSPRRYIAVSTMSPKHSVGLALGASWKHALAQRYLHVMALRPPWVPPRIGSKRRRPCWPPSKSDMRFPSSRCSACRQRVNKLSSPGYPPQSGWWFAYRPASRRLRSEH